jgi:hypothetical protein
MPKSERLKEREARTVRSERRRIRELDRDRRREPSECKEPNCRRPARHQGSLCEAHHDDTVLDKASLPLIYQGCPHFLPSYNRSRIRWAPFRWAIATWIEQNLELATPGQKLDKRLPEVLLVRGWKGASQPSLFDPKALSSKSG